MMTGGEVAEKVMERIDPTEVVSQGDDWAAVLNLYPVVRVTLEVLEEAGLIGLEKREETE